MRASKILRACHKKRLKKSFCHQKKLLSIFHQTYWTGQIGNRLKNLSLNLNFLNKVKTLGGFHSRELHRTQLEMENYFLVSFKSNFSVYVLTIYRSAICHDGCQKWCIIYSRFFYISHLQSCIKCKKDTFKKQEIVYCTFKSKTQSSCKYKTTLSYFRW